MIRSLGLVLLCVALSSGFAQAQQVKSKTEKAKSDFESEIKRIDGVLIKRIDDVLLKKTLDKTLQQKLNYERPLFINQHLVPTAITTDVYLLQRNKAIKTVKEVYLKTINDLKKELKKTEAEALENELNKLLKDNRGYGLAFPDLESNPSPLFQIENRDSGLVIDTEFKEGGGRLVLAPKEKDVRNKPSQCWSLEREEQGFMIRNVKSKGTFFVGHESREPGVSLMVGAFVERRDETRPAAFYRMISIRQEVVIEATSAELILTATEKKNKGVTTVFVTQEKMDKDTSPTAAQTWKLIEVK
jgi:hypothetical protein